MEGGQGGEGGGRYRELTRCNINPYIAAVIIAAKRYPLCLELKVSIRISLRKAVNFYYIFSAKAREMEF